MRSGRVFHNTPFGQPFRTRTWHEDHDFPEVEFPFSSTPMDDPLTGGRGALMRGDASDPKLIETKTSTEYWQKGASLLHTDPTGTRDLTLPPNVRTFLNAGTQHGGKAGMPRDNGPCIATRNWHDPMAAVRALLVALDEWVVADRAPPDSVVPRIDDGTLVPAGSTSPSPHFQGVTWPRHANDVTPLADWTAPGVSSQTSMALWCRRWKKTAMSKPGSACPTSLYRSRHLRWLELCAPPCYPAGGIGRPRRHVPGVRGDCGRAAACNGDPRRSVAERYPKRQCSVAP